MILLYRYICIHTSQSKGRINLFFHNITSTSVLTALVHHLKDTITADITYLRKILMEIVLLLLRRM